MFYAFLISLFLTNNFIALPSYNKFLLSICFITAITFFKKTVGSFI